jgi:hypothetical protein
VGRGDLPQRHPQRGHGVAGQPVIDPGAGPAGPHETATQELLQMVTGVGDALPDLLGELLDRPFPLGEKVDDLGAAPIAQRLRRRREPVEQRVLRHSVTHGAHPSSNERLTIVAGLEKHSSDRLRRAWRRCVQDGRGRG